jgi:glycosyltransferase involved in cell wall biosynthesis
MKSSSAGKKLLYLVTDVSTANIFGLVQLKYLSQKEFEIHLVCGSGLHHPDLTKFCDSIVQIKQLSRNISPVKDLFTFFSLVKLFYRIKPDLVIYATPKAALLGSVSARLTRTPIRIYQIWGARWQTLKGIKQCLVIAMDQITIKNSTNLISVSNSIEILYREITRKKNFVLGKGSAIGVDCNLFFFEPRSRLKSNLVIGYAGRLSKDKGIEDLVRIFELIIQRQDLTLELIGDEDISDPISKEVLHRIENCPNIRWIKNLDRNKLAEYIRFWEVQIFLSEREGLGNVILEAGACGIPTFCWKIVGTIDAIPEFASEFLIDYKNESKLIERIEKYLKNPFSEIEKINYSNWYSNNFNEEQVLRNLYDHIESFLVK